MASNKVFSFIFADWAKDDLDDILDYISNALKNQKAAADFYHALEKAIENICLFPYSSAQSDMTYDKHIVYKLFVDNYVVHYVVDEAKKVMHILRIRYAPQDLRGIF